ncbi:18534_t:CDS:1, partial [Racocetra persica]
ESDVMIWSMFISRFKEKVSLFLILRIALDEDKRLELAISDNDESDK